MWTTDRKETEVAAGRKLGTYCSVCMRAALVSKGAGIGDVEKDLDGRLWNSEWQDLPIDCIEKWEKD